MKSSIIELRRLAERHLSILHEISEENFRLLDYKGINTYVWFSRQEARIAEYSRDIASIEEELKEREQSMWIKVEAELPPLLQKVLFLWDALGVINIAMGYRCEEGWDIYLPYKSFQLNPLMVDVTHWMELPDYPDSEESK